ncbi:MAG: hypothetical protein CMH44_09030 [Muricauda sp.]|nr:hypothetical protein [Allomuricauda sp.]
MDKFQSDGWVQIPKAGSLPHHAVFISRLYPHHPQGAGPSLTAMWQLGYKIMKKYGGSPFLNR